MEKLVLIDGNSLINRAFYAMPLLTTKDGQYTNAVYGFMNMFTKMVLEIKPNYVAVAFDLKAPTFRHKMYADYKGTRKPMPEELRPQIPLLKEVLTLMGVKVLEKEGSEADDIIGTIAKATDVMTYIFTGDKDSFQLVDEQTEVHFTRRGISDVDVYTLSNFKEKTGINPEQVIDLKALMGDASDNIPGVSGVGEKTALSLVQTYETIDNLYLHTDELKGKLKEKIEGGKELCYLSKTLATIDVHVDVDTDLNHMTLPFPFGSEVKRKFIELEFKSLASKSNLFLDAPTQTVEQPSAYENSVATVRKVESLEEFNDVKGASLLSLVVLPNIVCLFDGKTEYQAVINQTLLDDGFNLGSVLTALLPLATQDTTLITFSKKELKHLFYANLKKDVTANVQDVSLLKYLLDFSGGEEKLQDVLDYYGKGMDAPACELYNVYNQLIAKLKAENMESLYYDVELPLADVLFDMEVAGFKIDAVALAKTGDEYKQKLNELEDQIRSLCDEPSLNVNSPKQLGEVLFEKLKIGKGKKTKTGYSTSADVLESLEGAHPVIEKILEFRKLQKLYSTYVEGFKPLIDKSSGLIHTSFNQTVTATGRLSSKEPNMQNIPVRDEQGRELRKFFVSRFNDGVIVGADYSQIELRLLASFSNSDTLISAFKSGKDIHSATASKVFKVPETQVTSQMRSKAKAVNFGIIYGITEYGLAKNVKTSAQEARNYINAYFEEYPEVKRYMNENVAFAKLNGYAVTVLNRKRYIKELASSNFNLRQFGERVAMNMPLQGSAADVIKLAMIGVYKRLKKENLQSKLILQVHDELLIDTTKEEEQIVTKILVEEMEGALKLSVPLTVSVGSGKTWFDAK